MSFGDLMWKLNISDWVLIISIGVNGIENDLVDSKCHSGTYSPNGIVLQSHGSFI